MTSGAEEQASVDLGDQAVVRGQGGETHQVAGRRPDPDHPAGRPGRRRPEHAAGRRAGAGRAGGLPLPREDLPLRPRAHPRAGRPRPRLRRARVLRELRAAGRPHPRRPVPAAGERTPAFVRFSTVAGNKGSADLARDVRGLRREALHAGGQLGPGRQQHPGVLHPGPDQVPGPDPRRQAGARPRLPAGPDRARQLLGLRVADAGVDAHAACGRCRTARSRGRSGSWRGSASTRSGS